MRPSVRADHQMPKYISEYVPEQELGAFLAQRERSGLAKMMEESIPGTPAFEAANRGKGRLGRLATVLGSAGGGTSSMALGKVIPAAASGQILQELTARALRSLPRGIREKLTRTSFQHRVEPEDLGTAAYHPLTGKIGVGPPSMADPQALESSLVHEFQHAADIGLVVPGELAKAMNRLRETVPEFMPYKESEAAYDKFRRWGYRDRDIPAELRAVGAEAGLGPVYAKGQGGQRLFSNLGYRENYPLLHETAQERFFGLRRRESKALLQAKKERGAQRRIRREEGLD